jgi:hypothetical protein
MASNHMLQKKLTALAACFLVQGTHKNAIYFSALRGNKADYFLKSEQASAERWICEEIQDNGG